MINWFTGIADKTKRYLGNLQFTHVIPDKWHGSLTKRAGPCSTIAHGNIRSLRNTQMGPRKWSNRRVQYTTNTSRSNQSVPQFAYKAKGPICKWGLRSLLGRHATIGTCHWPQVPVTLSLNNSNDRHNYTFSQWSRAFLLSHCHLWLVRIRYSVCKFPRYRLPGIPARPLGPGVNK